MIEAEQCQSMAEVRAGVDALDAQIVALLAARFRFMDAAARIKPTRDRVRDEERKAAVLEHVRGEAVGNGAPAEAIVSVYDALVEASIGYELERFDAR
jgi:isochorismate pyruvate lyase